MNKDDDYIYNKGDTQTIIDFLNNFFDEIHLSKYIIKYADISDYICITCRKSIPKNQWLCITCGCHYVHKNYPYICFPNLIASRKGKTYIAYPLVADWYMKCPLCDQ